MAIGLDQTVESLASDWRHRDQLTWQLPSVLVALSGALLTATSVWKNELADITTVLLAAGAGFAALLSFALLQNLYYQTVTEYLIEALNRGEHVDYNPIPKPTNTAPGRRQFIWRTILSPGKAGSTLLLALCIGLTVYLAVQAA